MHLRLNSLEGFDPEQYVFHGVYKGERSEGVLLNLLPGQEIPERPHDRFEITVLPLAGEATMRVNRRKEVSLETGTLYYEGPGSVISIKNAGETPFQALITLIRVRDLDHASRSTAGEQPAGTLSNIWDSPA